MRNGGPASEEEERLRRVTTRAIRRLDVLEYAILAVAALLAVAAGWLVAWLLAAVTTLPRRGTWIAASLLFFVVPGALAWWSNRRNGSGAAGPREESDTFDQ